MHKSKSKKTAAKGAGMAGELVKGAVVGAALSLLLIVVFAAAMWQQWLPTSSIGIVNTGIKVASAALAGIVAARRCTSRAWLTGSITGFAYSVLAFMVFAILSDTFTLTLMTAADIGIGTLSGMLAAMIWSAVK